MRWVTGNADPEGRHGDAAHQQDERRDRAHLGQRDRRAHGEEAEVHGYEAPELPEAREAKRGEEKGPMPAERLEGAGERRDPR